MIDDLDPSSSTLRLLVSEAIKNWPSEGLLELIADDDAIVRTAASREVHHRGDKIFFDRAIYLSSSNQAYLREISAFILGQLGTPKMPFKSAALPTLLSLSKDINADVRSAASAALGHLCYAEMPSEVEEQLLTLCSDNSVDVASCAAYALGNSSGSSRIIKRLREMTDLGGDLASFAELGLEIIESKRRDH